MNELTIIKRGGAAYIDSREVAEAIGKRHDNLLRDIGKYREIMARGGLLKVEESDFFVENSYLNAQNKPQPCYLLTKMGCELVANKLIGDKGILFTVAYVRKFNAMEQAERDELERRAANPPLKVFNTAIRNVLSGYSQTCASPNTVMSFLRGAYEPLGISVTEDSGSVCPFTATDVARLLGIYSVHGLPHCHAVASIIDRLNIAPEHIEVAAYGVIGISVRYDFEVIDAVCEWLAAHDYPHDIPHLDFFYHICYERDRKAQTSFFDDDYDSSGWFGDEE